MRWPRRCGSPPAPAPPAGCGRVSPWALGRRPRRPPCGTRPRPAPAAGASRRTGPGRAAAPGSSGSEAISSLQALLARLERALRGDQVRQRELRLHVVGRHCHRVAQCLLGGIDVLLQHVELRQAIAMPELAWLDLHDLEQLLLGFAVAAAPASACASITRRATLSGDAAEARCSTASASSFRPWRWYSEASRAAVSASVGARAAAASASCIAPAVVAAHRARDAAHGQQAGILRDEWRVLPRPA